MEHKFAILEISTGLTKKTYFLQTREMGQILPKTASPPPAL